MTKTPEEEQEGTEQVVTMETGDANGNTYDIKNSKSDDFFDDPPAKGVEADSSPQEADSASEQPLTNGHVEELEEPQTSQAPEVEAAETGSVTHEAPEETKEEPVQESQPSETEESPKDDGAPAEQTEEAADGGSSQAQEVQTDADKYNEEEEDEATETLATETLAGDSEPPVQEDATESGENNLAVAEPSRASTKASSYEDDFSSTTEGLEGASPRTATTTEGADQPEQQQETVENTGEGEQQADQPESEAQGETPQEPTSAEGEAGNEEEEKEEEEKEEEEDNEAAAHGVAPSKEGEEDEDEESRAEAGSVVPVVVDKPEVQADGRSTPEAEEKEGNRGEDRSEQTAVEGTEDSRGQGQWRPEDQQAIQDAMVVQQSEREQLEQTKAEREKLQQEYDALKSSNNEAIKDLQERLAILARENEEKDRQIFRLENDLKDNNSKLRETERKLIAAESARAAAGGEAPKSKTCVVM